MNEPARTADAVRDPDRLAALRRAALLDTPAEAAFDRLTWLAARILDAPIALVSLVDADRQFFKSCVGLSEGRETPLSHSFCQHVVTAAEPLIIEDAREHPLVRDNPAISALGVIAYAGIPLITSEGHALGSFCVIDTRPRAWTPEQIGILRTLAASVMAEIELRGAVREATREHAEKIALLESIPDGFFSTDREGRCTFLNQKAREIVGWGGDALPGKDLGKTLGEILGPDFETTIRRALTERKGVSTEGFAPQRGGWFEIKAHPSPDGGLSLYLRDVTEQKRAEAARASAEAARARMRTFMDTAPVGVLSCSPEGVLLYANREAERIWGLSLPEIETRGWQEGRLLDANGIPLPPDRTGLARALRGEIGENGVIREDLIIARHDGTRVPLLAHASRVVDQDGHLLGGMVVFVDLTERRRTEEALRLRERAIAEGPNGVVITDARQPDWPILYVNAAFERITGYSAAEALGKNCRFLQNEDRDQDGRETLRAALAAGESCRVVLRNYRKDGTLFWNELSLAPIHDEEGNITHYVGIQTDITERRGAQEALLQSERRFRSLVEATSQIVWTTDAEGRAIDMPQWRAFTGQTPEEVRRWGWLDAVHPDDRDPTIRAWLRAVASGDMYNVEYRVRGWDGTYRHFAARGVPVFEADGETIREWVGVCTDVTERKQAEAEREAVLRALQQSEERFRLLVEGARDYALLMLDAQGRIASWSAGAERIFGWSEEETLGQDAALFFTQEDREAGVPEREMQKAAAEGRSEDVRWHLRRDGSLFFADGVMTSLRDEAGNLRGFARVMRDVTERQRIEEERARLLAEVAARADRETLANQIGQALRDTPDPGFVQAVAVKELGQALGADRCYFTTYDTEANRAWVGQDWHRPDLPSVAGEYRMSGFGMDLMALLGTGETAVVNDLREHTGFSPETILAIAALGLRSGVTVPLMEGGRLVAALHVAMVDAARTWTADEIALVESVAAQTRSTMEAARFLQRELTIAEQLQDALTPSLPSRVPGLDLAAHYQPALAEANVGGDFFDVFPIEKGCTALVIGDLSGKGLQAASQVATVRNMLRFALYRGETLREAIIALNDTITEHDLLTGFVTLFAGVYDSGDGTFTYVSCGHESGLLYRAQMGIVEELPPTGPIIGAAAGSQYEAPLLTLAPGDVLLVYTDGLSEAGRNRYEFLETSGLAHLLVEAADNPSAQTIRARIVAGVEAHAGGTPHDDMCALVARVVAKEG